MLGLRAVLRGWKGAVCIGEFCIYPDRPDGPAHASRRYDGKAAGETPCSVVIRCGTRSADAKSILNVMALAAKCGETVTIEVSGEDEEATLQELREFFTANF